MRFPRTRRLEAEINLIPLIDVLLVILLYLLMQSATGDTRNALGINLPAADAAAPPVRTVEIGVIVAASGDVFVDGESLGDAGTDVLAVRLAALAKSLPPPPLVIRADAEARHQRVVDIMEAASRAGLTAVTFETAQRSPGAADGPGGRR
jgi:biopolymer transport protein ExbD